MITWLGMMIVLGVVFLFSEWVEWANGRRDSAPTFIKSLACQAVMATIAIMCSLTVIVCALVGCR